MYVITEAATNKVVYLAQSVEMNEVNRPVVDNGALAFGFECGVSEDMEIPAGVEPYKYLYVDGAFTLNPDYEEPVIVPTEAERLDALEAAISELAEVIVNG